MNSIKIIFVGHFSYTLNCYDFDSGLTNLILAGDTGTLATGNAINRNQIFSISFSHTFYAVPEVAVGYTTLTTPWANTMGLRISLT
jgi:hypothetical protein